MGDGIGDLIGHILGFEDEDVYFTSVSTVKCYTDETWLPTQNKLATEYMKSEAIDSVKYNASFIKMGDDQFKKYDAAGRWYYGNALPTLTLNSQYAVSINVFYNILRSLEGKEVSIENADAQALDSDIWCMWRLQEDYNYDTGGDIVRFGDNFYRYGSCSKSGSNYRVTLVPINKYVIETTRRVINTTTESTVIISDVYYEAKDTYNILIYTEELSTEVTEGEFEETDYVETISTREENRGLSNRVVTVAGYTNSIQWVVWYTLDPYGEARQKYWIYDYSTNKYPALNPVANALTNIKTLAVVPLRKNFKDINSNKSSTAYKKAYETLHSIDLNVDDLIKAYKNSESIDSLKDAFVVFGVVPSDNSGNQTGEVKFRETSVQSKEVVSYVLYDIMDSIYDRFPIGNSTSGSKYVIKVEHGSYNQHIEWYAYPTTIRNRVIGLVGKCKHNILSGILKEKTSYRVTVVQKFTSRRVVKITITKQPIYSIIQEDGIEIARRYGQPTTNNVGGWTSWRIEYDKDTGEQIRDEYIGVFVSEDYDTNFGTYPSGVYINNWFEYAVILSTYTEYIGSNEDVEAVERYVYGALRNPVVESRTRTTNAYGKHDTVEVLYFDRVVVRTTGKFVEDKALKSLVLTIQKQVSSTEVREFYLYDITSSTLIKEDIGDDGGCEVEINSKDFIFPIPLFSLERLTWMQKTAFISKCIHMQFWAYEHKHLKWYETESFSGFMQSLQIPMMIVALAMSIFSGGQSITLTAVLWALVKAAIIAVAATLAIQLILLLTDDIVLRTLAITAVMVAAMLAGGSFSNGFNGFTAVELCMSVVRAYSIAVGDYTQQKMEDLKSEVSEFQEEYKSRQESYEAAFDSFAKGLNVYDVTEINQVADDSFELASPILMPPSQFYELALNSYKNIDFLYTGYYDSTVHKFCEQQLRLGFGSDET